MKIKGKIQIKRRTDILPNGCRSEKILPEKIMQSEQV